MTVQTLYTAATGMEALETKLDVIANNMANINTTGFKKDRANFEDVFYRQYRLPGAQDADGNSHGDRHRGRLGHAGFQHANELQARCVRNDEQPARFRDRRRRVLPGAKSERRLLLHAGGQLQFERQRRNRAGLGKQRLSVGAQHHRSARGDRGRRLGGRTDSIQHAGLDRRCTSLGQLQLAKFVNPDGLLKLGDNLYQKTDASGDETTGNPGQTGFGNIRQGFLEASNVEPVNELIDLITTQRSFELNSQVVQAGDQIMQIVANLRRLG